MSAPVVAFFGLKGGQGKTTLVHHLAWMFSDLGVPVVAADLDPQCALTQLFLGPDATVALAASGRTVHAPFRRRVERGAGLEEGDLAHPGGGVTLLAGDLALYEIEATLADAFRAWTAGDERAERTLLALRSVFEEAATASSARMVLVDLASAGGLIARAALVAADYLVLPLKPDPLAIKTLRFIGERLDEWRGEWRQLRGTTAWWPHGGPAPLGYVVQMFPTYSGRPTRSAQRSMNELPAEFGRWVAQSHTPPPPAPQEDEYCLGVISPMNVLFSTAADLQRPVFHLTPADGAVGSVMRLVQRARAEYEAVALAIAGRLGIQR